MNTPTSASRRTPALHLPRRRRARRGAAVLLAVLAASLLGGCALLSGSDERERSTVYAPDPRATLDPSLPTVDWTLSLSPPTAARVIDNFRVAVRPTPDELQVYRGATWAKIPSDMLQDAMLRTLEDSGKIGAIARPGASIASDYRLLVDLRRFEADYAGNAVPAATVEFNAKLVHSSDQSVVASRTFLFAEPAGDTDVASVVDAFSRALAASGRELSGWILLSGDAHRRGTPR